MDAEVVISFEELERLAGWWPVLGVPIDSPVLELYPAAARCRWHVRQVNRISRTSREIRTEEGDRLWSTEAGYRLEVDLDDDEPQSEQVFEYLDPSRDEDVFAERERRLWEWRRELIRVAGLAVVAWAHGSATPYSSRPHLARFTLCTASWRPVRARP